MEFGQRFRQIRKENGYTQKQVAQLLGLSQPNISDWENNDSRPEYENLIALARLYDESVDYLLGVEEIK